MAHHALPGLFLSALGLSLFVAPAAPVEDHPSEVSRVLAAYAPEVSERSPAAMAGAAQALLDALDEDHHDDCAHPLESDERGKWTNVPPRMDDAGLRLGDLDEANLKLACDLLATCLSDTGYAKVRDILLADDLLLPEGKPRPGFGAENYWLLVFGTPSADGRWALQLDGHHIAVNLTFDGEQVSMSPSFIGTQPARYERGDATIEPLRGEVEAAFALLESLDDGQRADAIVSDRRGRIAAGPGQDGVVPAPAGLPCSRLNEVQRVRLIGLLRHYVAGLPEPHATARLLELKGEIDRMHFAWSGGRKQPGDVSYRLQGPSVIIEYACQDLGGDPLQHLHSMYRDPSNEYGAGFESR
ncbi:MAG: DUF3500 domain-containing protein [Planctomycetota bacterium]